MCFVQNPVLIIQDCHGYSHSSDFRSSNVPCDADVSITEGYAGLLTLCAVRTLPYDGQIGKDCRFPEGFHLLSQHLPDQGWS